MFKHKVVSSIVAGLVFAPAAAWAQDKAASADVSLGGKTCVFEKYAPLAAAPLKTSKNLGYGTHEFVNGAQIFVAAQPGLTKEWLELSIQRTLASERACRPGVDLLRVSVVSAGSGFWVQLTANEAEDSQEVLEWATKMVKRHASQPTAAVQR